MKRAVTLLLVLAFSVPTVLSVAAPRAHAQFGGAVAVISDTSLTGLYNLAKNTISAAADVLTSNNSTAIWLKEYVLDPIAWAVSQQLIQSVTGSIIGFVNGQGNGTGQSQFVQNLLQNLWHVGDGEAMAFLSQFGRSSNSPFASVITSALYRNYGYQTSLAGFFAANQCTLSQVSPNINQFVAGDWSQGGVQAWFALTTQEENNPFTLYQRAQGQLGSMVAAAQFARTQDYQAGQGFISWCGTSDSSTDPLAPVTVTPAQTEASSQDNSIAPVTVTPEQCMNSDGTMGTIQTPGSVIKGQLDKVLGSGVDKLVSADEFDEIIGALAQQLISGVLGGASGGLAGISQPSSTGASPFVTQFQNQTPAQASGGTTGSSSSVTLANSVLTNVASDEAAWNTILSSAQSAATSLTSLSACSAYSAAAQSALTSEVQPVITEAQTAIQTAEQTKALANKVLAEASANSTSLVSDTQTLANASPSAADVAQVQPQAESTGTAVATPDGSLTVSGGTTLDQMQLIGHNAQTYQASCAAGGLP